MCSIVNQSTSRKCDQSEVVISGRLANQKPGKRTNQKSGYKRNNQSTSETHTSFDMSRKSKSKNQTQALNIPVKVPLGGGRYAELTEWNGIKNGFEILENRYDSYQVWCQLVFVTVENIVQCYASGGRFDQSSERRRYHLR